MQVSGREKNLPFEQDVSPSDTAFLVDVDGFEGPLDLLLELARRQKVDLAKISVLALAEQYLAFIEAARNLRFELAADYLVMGRLARLSQIAPAASPQQDKGRESRWPRISPLRWRFACSGSRQSARRRRRWVNRPRLGRDIFTRGQPEAVEISRRPQWQARPARSACRLRPAAAKTGHRQISTGAALFLVAGRGAHSARRLAGQAFDWTVLDSFLMTYFTTPEARRAVKASSLAAALEMVCQGAISLRQDQAFAPLWIKKRDAAASPAPVQ